MSFFSCAPPLFDSFGVIPPDPSPSPLPVPPSPHPDPKRNKSQATSAATTMPPRTRKARSIRSGSRRLKTIFAPRRQRTHVKTLPSMYPPATARTYITYFPALVATSASAKSRSTVAVSRGERPVKLELYVLEPAGVIVRLLLLRVPGLLSRVENQEEGFLGAACALVQRDERVGRGLIRHVDPLTVLQIVKTAIFRVDFQDLHAQPLGEVSPLGLELFHFTARALEFNPQFAHIFRQFRLLGLRLGLSLRRLDRRGHERHQKEDAEQEDEHVNERHEEPRDAPPGAFDHCATPGRAPRREPNAQSEGAFARSNCIVLASRIGFRGSGSIIAPLPVSALARRPGIGSGRGRRARPM